MELLEASDVGACDHGRRSDRVVWSPAAVMHYKALGVKISLLKVKDEVTQQVLEKVGADLVILPEVGFLHWPRPFSLIIRLRFSSWMMM